MEDHCEAMKSISGSVLLRVTLIFGLTTSIIALPLIVLALYTISCARTSKLIHVNAVIIFQVHLMGFFIHCFSRSVLHSLDLYNYATLDYCDMTPSTYRCFVFRLMYVSSVWILAGTTVSMVIERCIATKKSASYEHTGSSLGIALFVLQISIATVPTWLSFKNFSFQEPVMNYCSAIREGFFGSMEMIVAVSLAIQIIARILFHFLLKMNENLRIKQLTSSLSNRYSLEQNLKSMRILQKFADLQAFFLVIHMTIFIFLLPYGSEMDKPTYISLVELSAQYPLYAIVSIIGYLKNANATRVKVKKVLDLHVHKDQNLYFENFKKSLS